VRKIIFVLVKLLLRVSHGFMLLYNNLHNILIVLSIQDATLARLFQGVVRGLYMNELYFLEFIFIFRFFELDKDYYCCWKHKHMLGIQFIHIGCVFINLILSNC